jgi:glucose uptake protein GlcU
MIILMTLLIAGTSMAFAVHQWRRGYHLIAIGFITLACLIAGVAIEAAKNNHNAKATEVLQQP